MNNEENLNALARMGALFKQLAARVPEDEDWPQFVRAVEWAQERLASQLGFEPGQEVFVVERDENDDPCDFSGYMFIASAGGHVIVSPFINDIDRLDLTMVYLAEDSAEGLSSSLRVFPWDDCYSTREDAQRAVQEAV